MQKNRLHKYCFDVSVGVTVYSLKLNLVYNLVKFADVDGFQVFETSGVGVAKI